MTNTLAIGMQKGGVGKTTVAVNLTDGLADRGHETLLIDIDPQGYATKSLGLEEAYLADELNVADVLLDVKSFDRIDEIVVGRDRFDVLPSHIDAFQLERELWFESRTQERLSMALERLDHSYDFVVIDTPPNLGPLTDNGILAAQDVLFPGQSRTSSIDALKMLFDQIETLELEYDVPVGMVGAVINQTRNDGMSDQMREWYVEQFGSENVFEIPFRVALQYAWEAEQTIYEYDERDVSDVRDVFDRLVTHIENYYE
ncbi:ParA family protein [Halegenticoccus tardaugens]|uniref:ParA family protein n=1 Tax=Halegenticoccus tardaugens TaxID=2071624 RepID=UPI00100A93C8|nr:ParA family protein [Halegenticoccus tardaugens]